MFHYSANEISQSFRITHILYSSKFPCLHVATWLLYIQGQFACSIDKVSTLCYNRVLVYSGFPRRKVNLNGNFLSTITRGCGRFSTRLRRVHTRGSKWIEPVFIEIRELGGNDSEQSRSNILATPRHGILRPLVARFYYTLKLRVMRWSRDLGLDFAIFTLQPVIRVGGSDRGKKLCFSLLLATVTPQANLLCSNPLESQAIESSCKVCVIWNEDATL